MSAADATGRPHRAAVDGSIALSSATGLVGHVCSATGLVGHVWAGPCPAGSTLMTSPATPLRHRRH
ncbi:hypothetical protein [Streptosporangium canum]|uniref:hypothetical protein n=1 Tax=Streptosporangium canum TaxID=324952 RepID=UPI0015A588F3|nr:hypothetical protein [Streptosporangium canum]